MVEDNSGTPFQWGTFDCSQFCIQAQQVMYGHTIWGDMIGGYKSKKGAMSRIKRKGAESLWELIDKRMDRLHSVKLAMRGDWVGHYTEDGESLGICLGSHFVCVCLDGGLVVSPMTEAKVVWRG